MTQRRLAAIGVLAAAGGAALLVVNALAVRAGRPLPEVLPLTYRYWEDVRAGAAAVAGASDVALVPASGDAFTEAVVTETARRGIEVTTFWRSIPLDDLPPPTTDRITALEDVGRARLLAVAFRAMGGVAPYLLLWVPVLLAAPALCVLAGAFASMGRPLAGIVLTLLAGASAFFADALFLSYSPVGFYVVALFLLAAFSAWAASTPALRPRPAEFALALAGGLTLALCAACRGGVLLLAPGFFAAGLVLVIRAGRERWPAVAIAALLIVPAFALRPSESHSLWIGVWEGLGDFDRERDHFWSDAAAKRALRAAGVDDLRGLAAEGTMRRLVLADVRDDPAWYAAILARRVRAVLRQDKIAPPGHALAAPNGPGEGAMDGYYGLTRHADTYAMGNASVEVPTWMLWAPLALLATLALARGGEWRRDLIVVAPIAAGALGVPVLVSTAGAFETQAFVLVHLAAAALLVDGAARTVRGRSIRPAVAREGSSATTARDTA